MSVSAVVEPNTTTPAYNPVQWWVDSTNKNETGFRYVVDVYDSTPTKIAEYRVAPRIDDGYGVIDLSRLLSSQVTKTLDLTNTTSIDATDSYFKYSVEFGEEYNTSYAYTGFANSSGYVQLTGFSSHPFVVGDQINITEGTPTNPLLDGLHTVTAIAATTLTIDVLYADLVAPSSTAGDVIYADNRKSLTRSMLIKSNYYVFNGAISWIDFRSYQDTTFLMGNTGARFLTNIPDNFYVRESQDIYLNLLPQTASTRYLYFENSNGDTFYKDITAGAATEWVTQTSCGPNNLGSLTLVSGSAPLVQSDTEWYDVTFTDNAYAAQGETLRFYIDRTCSIEDYEILFMDRLGSYASFAFTLKANETGTIKKTNYKENNEGSASGTDWTYDTTARGSRVLDVTVEKMLTLNSNWMTREMNEYFEEMLTSGETYLKVDGTYQACIVEETSFETARQKRHELIRKTVKVKLANNDSLNW